MTVVNAVNGTGSGTQQDLLGVAANSSALSPLVCAVVLSRASSDVQSSSVLRVAVPGQQTPQDASIAASCLLQPEAGDQVLLGASPLSEGKAKWWVVAVMQRLQGESVATLGVPGGATPLQLRALSLSVVVQERFDLAAGEVEVATPRATLHAGVLQMVASAVDVVARRLTRVAQAIHSVAGTVTEQCRTRVAVVDEVNSSCAGIELQESTDAMMLKGRQVMVDAEKTVRMDGQHILMG